MERWQQFDRREQGMLLLGAVVIALLMLWSLVVQPLRSMVDDQRADNRVLSHQLQEARTMAAELKRLKQQSASKSRSGRDDLEQLLVNTAPQHKLSISEFTPNNDNSVQLQFNLAPFNGLLTWLYQLESSHDVSVDNLSINPTQDSGIVSVSVRLRGN